MDHEVGMDRLPFRHLKGDTLKAVLAALRVHSGDKRGHATDERAQQCRNRAQQGWIDAHVALPRLSVSMLGAGAACSAACACAAGSLIPNQAT